MTVIACRVSKGSIEIASDTQTIGAMECGASVTQAVKIAIKYDLYCGGKVNRLKL